MVMSYPTPARPLQPPPLDGLEPALRGRVHYPAVRESRHGGADAIAEAGTDPRVRLRRPAP